jgi:hypothetical protein
MESHGRTDHDEHAADARTIAELRNERASLRITMREIRVLASNGGANPLSTLATIAKHARDVLKDRG